ncbi:MAG: hypothetical protein HC843_13685 [Sphingomonadales bacterium]|nr:hypothetical protein [Sphingomonadales bacterium]
MKLSILFYLTAAMTVSVPLTACAPSDSDVEQAVRDNWPREQAALQERGRFLIDQSESFAKSAARSARIENKLKNNPFFKDSATANDDGDSVSKSHGETSRAQKAEAQEALALAEAKIKSVSNIRCKEAVNKPGQFCEFDVQLAFKNGEENTASSAYRFDEVDGKFQIVGLAE